MILSYLKTAAASLLLLSTTTLSAQDITEPTEYYVMHASGLHLASGYNGHGILEGADAVSPQKMTVTPVGDGFYTIKAPGGGVLMLDGKWDTKFSDDTALDNTKKFSFTKVGNTLIKIKCAANNKYLGTDNLDEGCYVFADKGGDDSLHYWYLSNDMTAMPDGFENTYIINPEAQRQLFEGWGVSLCWWANVCGKWSDEKIDELIEWLTSPDELNFRIFRYNIGGGDDPNNTYCTAHHMGAPGGKGLRAEMEGFKDSSDGDYIWGRDEAQRKIMLKIKEKRPDAIFEAFSNSAPYYMTYSGCCAGNNPSSADNLKPEYYEEFAHYLVDVCKHYKDVYGIEFRTLDPFNEPMTSYWGANGGQEGCHFDVASQIAFLKVLSPILKESGLATVISASDETSVAQSVSDFTAYRDGGVLDLVGQWNTHTYSADNKSRAKISALCAENNIPLWMSEVGYGGSGFSGNLKLAEKLINDMRYIMPVAWIDWQYVEENQDQWCLVNSDSFEAQSYNRVKNYYVRAHFSRFIKEGYTILTSFNNNTLAARSADGKELVLVAINSEATPAEHYVDLSMFPAVGKDSDVDAYITTMNSDMEFFEEYLVEGKKLEFSMPGKSIVTLVIPVDCGSLTAKNPVDGGTYLLCARLDTDKVAGSNGEGIVLQPATLSDAQIWKLDGSRSSCTLTNRSGEIITDGGGYGLSVSKNAGSGQTFSFEAVGNGYYRILNCDGSKAFDLEGEKADEGTKVGLWAYAHASGPVHRQWMPVRVDVDGTGIEELVASVDKESPVRISNNESGCLSVESKGAAGELRVFSADGTLLYKGMVAGGELRRIPLSAGIFLLSFAAGTSGAYAVTVLVK